MAQATAKRLRELEQKGDYGSLIAEVRELIAADRRALAEPRVKEWCGRRWRNIFITEAAADPEAVKAAARRLSVPGTDLAVRRGGDPRPDRQKVAERFLHKTAGDWEVEMPEAEAPALDRTAVVLCPGLITGMLPVIAFQSAFPALEQEHGWRFLRADAHPMRGCEANVEDLRATIERGLGFAADGSRVDEGEADPPRNVILIGYSKGTADALALLALHPGLAERVRALFCWGGAVGGSYLADDILAQIEGMGERHDSLGEQLRELLQTVFPMIRFEGATRLDEYDVKAAIGDLTTGVREKFLADHGDALDALGVPFFNVTAATRAMEVPHFQVQGYMEIARIDPDNDMQLTQDQARMKGEMATDLAVLHAHHWDISYEPFPLRTRLGSPNLDHRFPRKAAVSAIVKLSAELGLIE